MTESYRIRWLKKALKNLDEQIEIIAKDNPQVAQQQCNKIETALNYLLIHPYAGRPGRVIGTRELVVPHTSFLLPYKVKFKPSTQIYEIQILRVFHTSRRLPKDW